MADISKIVSNGVTYNIKDAAGRTTAANAAVASTYLSVQTKSIDNQTIAAGSATTLTIDVSRSGYTPLGVVGVQIANASSSGTRYQYCHEYGWYFSSTNTIIALRNYYPNAAAKIKASVHILYRKN